MLLARGPGSFAGLLDFHRLQATQLELRYDLFLSPSVVASAMWPIAARPVQRAGKAAENEVVTALAPHPAVVNDDVLDALSDLVAALAANADRVEETLRRAEAIREERSAGLSYREIEIGQG